MAAVVSRNVPHTPDRVSGEGYVVLYVYFTTVKVGGTEGQWGNG